MSFVSNAFQGGGDDAGSIKLLFAILNEIGASEFLQQFIKDDQGDESIPFLSKMKPERLAIKYGLPQDLAAAFVERCREKAGKAASSSASVSSVMSSVASSATSSLAPAAAASQDDVALVLRKLNLEMVGKLGSGGFGTVYKCKDAIQKRFVAVKMVNDPKNALAAKREGQKLLRAKHKNIVQMYRVHDLNPYLGNDSCALEMEVVTGGDLFEHLKAARRRPERRLPLAAVLRFSRQLLEALVYLHDEIHWLHGDIKPQNLLMNCRALPDDGSAIDYSDAEIKLADFGLSKVMGQEDSSASFMLSNATTIAGQIKGTMWYLTSEALRGASAGYERTYSDDLWSACLVIYEMDTGLSLEQLMNVPGAIRLEELLAKTSRTLLPMLASVLAVPDAASRCKSAAELLQKLDASMDPLYIWEEYDATAGKYACMHPAASYVLEMAFLANDPLAQLPLQPPLDLIFDIKALLSSATALGSATERSTGDKRAIRRLLKPSALTSSCDIPIWQQLVDGKEWLQCPPATCAKLEIHSMNANAAVDAARYRRMTIESGSIGDVQLPHAMRSEPYLAPARADDVAVLTKRVHESLPEWDITEMVQVVNPALASKYAANRHRLAARCNGNPNERMLFHWAHDRVIPKIWQAGEGFETRLAQWAEVGKGAYFCEHIIYNYAYKFDLWAPPDKFKVVAEPPVGTKMQVFAVLVCLGNVADMGPGCESCPSPAFTKWKKEFDYQKKAPGDNPLPTRPPAIQLPSDAAERQHLLDLNQIKDEPRHDSVTSTEGDLATHPDSNCKTAAGQPMRDVMHPRLTTKAKEWGKQCVLFESASYPVFLLTLKKTGCSPVGAQQLLDAGCDANRLKALGVTARDFKALGKTVPEMRTIGWNVSDLKDAGYDPQLILKEYKASALSDAGFTIKDLQDAGHEVEFISEGFTPTQLKNSGYGLSDMKLILKERFNASALKDIGFTIKDLQDAGCDVKFMSEGKAFTVTELKNSGYGLIDMKDCFKHSELKSDFTYHELEQVGIQESVTVQKYLFPFTDCQGFKNEKEYAGCPFLFSLLVIGGLATGAAYCDYKVYDEWDILRQSHEMNAINASIPVKTNGPYIGWIILEVLVILSCFWTGIAIVATYKDFALLMIEVIFLPLTIPYYIVLRLVMFFSYLRYLFKTFCFASPRRIHPLTPSNG
jgi:serine/threonine protein kinase